MMKKLFEKMATQFQNALAENVQNYIFILNIFYLKNINIYKKICFLELLSFLIKYFHI